MKHKKIYKKINKKGFNHIEIDYSNLEILNIDFLRNFMANFFIYFYFLFCVEL